MNKLKVLIFPIILFFVIDTNAQYDWKLVKDKADIKVYTRKVEGHKLKEVKAIVIIYANIKDIVNVVSDFNTHNDWVDNCFDNKLCSVNGV